jgi:hypothetical protein
VWLTTSDEIAEHCWGASGVAETARPDDDQVG